ncbi:S9 family peptidase [Crocinitomix algicola]|uniref:S9 family peptidase n=1 Tax=Crocinitomix algicola TaxID=1740263 RepID=UPI000829F9C7|nr:DPP IV N-terminal domain-containing protein [Crocinitomix algicola]
MKKIVALLFIGLMSGFVIGQKQLTLEDAVMNQYRAYYPEHTNLLSWIPNTNDFAYLSSDYQTLLRGNTKNDKTSEIITTKKIAELTGLSPRYVNVLSWKDEHRFITSIDQKFYEINITKQSAKELGSVNSNSDIMDFSPASLNIVYNEGDVLFLTSKSIPITVSKEGVVSGQAIARSEFGITKGTFWSNNGTKLAYYQKDESEVAEYPLLDITTPTGSLNSIRYPMAGQKSEKGAVCIYDVESEKTVKITPSGKEDDYVTNFAWGPDDKYCYVAELNRGQDHMKLMKYDATSGELVKVLFEEENDRWVEPEHPVYFVSNDQFVWLSERDGFMNLYLYDADGKLQKQLTKNKWVVKELLGHDDNGNIYFMGTGESPLETHAYKVNINTGKQTKLTQIPGTHRVSFSSNYEFMHDAYSSHEIPNREEIVDLAKGKVVRTLIEAANPYENITMGTAEISTLKSGDQKVDLYQRLIKPSNFDPSKKYPVLVYVYGGPHAQLITNSWLDGASLWMYWLAEQGYLVYTIDGRGSANRGFEFESGIHRQLGELEMQDQIVGVKHLRTLDYVDGNRLAVHGWSFGGFMTTSLMLRNAGIFNVGVAGGPVTDWKYYEVMYGERYMDTPTENPEGYKNSALTNYVENLKGDLLLIHGTSDDVVVMQHNLALVKAFIEAGVQMDFFPYPMHKHNVYGKDRVHLMQKVLDYIIENN